MRTQELVRSGASCQLIMKWGSTACDAVNRLPCMVVYAMIGLHGNAAGPCSNCAENAATDL